MDVEKRRELRRVMRKMDYHPSLQTQYALLDALDAAEARLAAVEGAIFPPWEARSFAGDPPPLLLAEWGGFERCATRVRTVLSAASTDLAAIVATLAEREP